MSSSVISGATSPPCKSDKIRSIRAARSATSIRFARWEAVRYQHLLLAAEKKFWRCVESGDAPHLFGVEPPRPRIEAVRIIDISSSNSWGGWRGCFARPARLSSIMKPPRSN